MRAKASVLVGLLWCVALLSVLVIGVLHTARLDLLVVKNYGDRIQAHYLALAGIAGSVTTENSIMLPNNFAMSCLVAVNSGSSARGGRTREAE